MTTGIPHGPTAGFGGPRQPHGTAGSPSAPPGGWTAGRVVALVVGSVLTVITLGLLAGGGILMWADQGMRQDGFVSTRTASYSTTGYALASERVSLDHNWLLTGLVGDIQLRVTPASPGRAVFVAVGPADGVAAYLAGTSYTTARGTGADDLSSHFGTARPALPQSAGIWAVQSAGTGTQTLRWPARAGDWMAVAMNADGSPGLAVRADAGVSAPWLYRLALELIAGGIVAGMLSVALIAVPLRLAAGTGGRD
jgi:hypothetical protein